MEIYTIGHSDLAPERFVELLRRHDVDLVVDVRSHPYSRFVPWTNRSRVKARLAGAGIAHLSAGRALGGRPRDPALRTATGGPDYGKIDQQPAFRHAIDVLLELAARHRLALLCSEADPLRCHRHRLIAPALLARGCTVRHILPDGRLAEVPAGPRLLHESAASYRARLASCA